MIAVVLGIVLVGSSASLIAPKGEKQPEISLGGEAFPVARNGERWTVTVHPAERVKVFAKDLSATLEAASQKLREIHILSGKIVAFFLKNRSDQELEAELRALTDQDEISVDRLNRQADIRLLANGWDKSVYTVDFREKASDAPLIRIVLKISKGEGKTIRRETLFLKTLNREEKGTVPEMGKMFKAGIRSAFFEEFVSGPSVGSLIRKGEFSLETRRATLETIVRIHRALGVIPLDILPHNFIVNGRAEQEEGVVIIDLGRPYLEKPGSILEALHIQYGDKRFQGNDLIFQTILEVLGEGKGGDFLQEALAELKGETRSLRLFNRHSVYFDQEKWKMGRLEQMGVEFKRKRGLLELTKDLESYLSLLSQTPSLTVR
jgi:hypothetical protein